MKKELNTTKTLRTQRSTKKIINGKVLFLMLITAFLLGACKKEEKKVTPPIPDNELITTVKIRLENTTNVGDTIWAIWKDVSNGANPPDTSKAVINLKNNSTYKASVYFFDDTKNPAGDITAEVRELSNFHSYWFFKSVEIANNLTITATDKDSNNPPYPVGLENTFVTSATACTGRLEGILKHQPDGKDGTFAPGSSDSDVFFTLNVLP